MHDFAQGLQERARELGLSSAEVARRAALSERRYSYYATGEQEPNLATLVRICNVLAATPDDRLLPGASAPPLTARDRLLTRIGAATSNLSDMQLGIAACQIECLTVVRRAGRRGRR